MKTVLETIKVTKQFANHKALDEVSIAVPDQSIFGLLGPNGAGKTTLIRIINQITGPDSGTVKLYGEQLQSKHISNIGYLPEERGLYKKMKVGEQALYLAQLKGLSKEDALRKLKYWFDKFDILSWWNRKVEELSKGMQQKVQFIVTIVHDPKLLIFDEPFSGFDPINVNLLKDEILALKEKGATIIFSTHNMASVEELCNHIALIDRSKKILEGQVQHIKEQYKSNTFEVSYSDPKNELPQILGDDFQIIEELNKQGKSVAKVRLQNGSTQNDLLGKLISQANILSFNEILPTMNEIFIQTVNKNTQTQNRHE
jgi:ABC-2 type transport system ATP-binding protein